MVYGKTGGVALCGAGVAMLGAADKRKKTGEGQNVMGLECQD